MAAKIRFLINFHLGVELEMQYVSLRKIYKWLVMFSEYTIVSSKQILQ